MLLLDNFIHSDLHPGNIMVKFCKPTSASHLLRNLFSHLVGNSQDSFAVDQQSDSDTIVERLRALIHSPAEWRAELSGLSTRGYIPEIVFIDAGLVTTLDTTDRRNFLDLFRAVAEFDGYRAGQLMVERCRTPFLARDPETFALKMQHLVLSVKRKTFSLGQIKISDILTEVLRSVRTHHVKMEADFINTVISILLLEGIGRQLDPALDLFKSALPILRQLGRQMAAQESISQIPASHFGALFKVRLLPVLLRVFSLLCFIGLGVHGGQSAGFVSVRQCG
jgi:aarF domain-containing kinase